MTGFPDGQRRGVRGGLLVAVQLGHIEMRDARDLLNARGRRVDKDADATHARGSRDFAGAIRRDIAWAARVEVEAEGGGAAFDRRRGVRLAGDAADLEDHAATNAPSAAAGSTDFMRCSPTRNAV